MFWPKNRLRKYKIISISNSKRRILYENIEKKQILTAIKLLFFLHRMGKTRKIIVKLTNNSLIFRVNSNLILYKYCTKINSFDYLSNNSICVSLAMDHFSMECVHCICTLGCLCIFIIWLGCPKFCTRKQSPLHCIALTYKYFFKWSRLTHSR